MTETTVTTTDCTKSIVKTMELEGENYRLELMDSGCGYEEEPEYGPSLTFEAEDESAGLSQEHTEKVVAWLIEWQFSHRPHSPSVVSNGD